GRLNMSATLSREEIARVNIDWIVPKDRRSVWRLLGLWLVFGDRRGYRQQNEQRNICSSPAHSEPSLQDLDAHFFRESTRNRRSKYRTVPTISLSRLS